MSHLLIMGHNNYEPSPTPLKQFIWPGPVTPSLVLPTPLQFGAISRIEFSGNGEYLAIAYNHEGGSAFGAPLAIYAADGLTQIAALGEGEWFSTFYDLVFDPVDAAWLAANNTSNDLQIIDPADGSVIATVEPPSGSYQGLSVLPDGSAALVGSSADLVLIDTSTWAPSVVVTTSTLYIQTVAASPNGQWVAVSFYDNAASTWGQVYAVSDWSLVATIPRAIEVDDVRVLSWSPDSSRLAIGGEYGGTLKIYDTGTWTAVSGTPSVDPSAGLYAPDGSLLHLIVSGALKTYDASTWALLDTQTVGEYDTALAVTAAVGLRGVSGIVYDASGAPCARPVTLLRRSDGLPLDRTTSDATTGAYSLSTLVSAECLRVAHDTTGDYNDLIDRVVPA